MGQSNSTGNDTINTQHFKLPGIDLSNVKKYNSNHVAKHNTSQDCWVILHNYIFNVTKFLNDHPPGAHLITSHAGKDITNLFEENNHSEYARSLLTDMFIGILDENAADSDKEVENVKSENNKNSESNVTAVSTLVADLTIESSGVADEISTKKNEAVM